MNRQSTAVDLLRLLLALPEGQPVVATPSFRSWVAADDAAPWPPTERAGGLWLVDTRDRIGRGLLRAWKSGRMKPEFDAALVLAGSGVPGTAVRRALRRLRRPGTRRLSEARTAVSLPTAPVMTCLAFEDGLHVPAEFEIADGSPSTGTAFLLTRRPAFEAGIWTLVREHLRDPDARVLGFQLRVRGAAVCTVWARGRTYIVRVVPSGSLQDVVLRNHSSLLRLRGQLNGEDALLRLMPEPIAIETSNSVALLAETCLEGTLAWKVASGELAATVHRNAVAFLQILREATAQSIPLSRESMDALLEPDLQRLGEATFVGDAVRNRIQEELRGVAQTLTGFELPLHTSHGDYGYGNLLVHPHSGELTGVIDWDTARAVDLPGVDRVNLEIQIRRTALSGNFARAVRDVWQSRAAHEALAGPGGSQRERALFALAVCRYILRSFSYPAVYRKEAEAFERGLKVLGRIEAAQF